MKYTIGALVAAVLIALGFNKCELPKETVQKIKIVRDTVYKPVPYTVRDTSFFAEIKSLKEKVRTLNKKVKTPIDKAMEYVCPESCDTNLMTQLVENLDRTMNENRLLITDKNELIDMMSNLSNRVDTVNVNTTIQGKFLKNGIGLSYGIIDKPIYQVIYERSLSKNFSAHGGVLWNGKPGIIGGIKIRF